ncbi:hypothetical protein WI38_32785 [Burkholderia ubonensis]|uniref:Uncharacterized protein n=2 Tax=Burkholderia ubonensis TaxID=101571 RepID=A0A102KT40_9BURK|nr:hypothetical protein WI35_15550 [Burkholderia ubonensis]KUZ81080.1 hypothetical protein WI38_32785 [Burkholderia ubonensis]KVA02746.1 hypothetical protein WI39_33005 [Burkholderia ubonensis]
MLVIDVKTGSSIGECSFVIPPQSGEWIEFPEKPNAATMFEVVKVVHPVTGDCPDIYVRRLGDNHAMLDRLCSEQSASE